MTASKPGKATYSAERIRDIAAEHWFQTECQPGYVLLRMPCRLPGKHTGMLMVEMASTAAGTGGPTGAGAREVAESAEIRGIIAINVAGRRLELLPPEQIGFLAGVALLAAFEIIEWPVAVVVAVGHTLAYRTRRPGLRSFGTVIGKA